MPQVVRKRQGLDQLFQTPQRTLVALAVGSVQVRRDGGKQLGDVGEAGVDFLLDVCRKVGVDLFYPARVSSDSNTVLVVARCKSSLLHVPL